MIWTKWARFGYWLSYLLSPPFLLPPVPALLKKTEAVYKEKEKKKEGDYSSVGSLLPLKKKKKIQPQTRPRLK